MEFGIFNSLYCPSRPWRRAPIPSWSSTPGCWTRWPGPRPPTGPGSSTRGPPSTTSSRSTRTSRPTSRSSPTWPASPSNIHLGSGIINITPPVNHPARVAERVAMIDHLSGGRFEFGMGRGSSTTEQAGFGITDPDLTKAMCDEALPQIVRMWTETDYSLRGRVLLDAAPQRAAQALHQAPPAAVGRGRQPGHLREGGADGPRRPLLRHLQPRGAQAADRALQEQHRRRRARRRLRQRQHHGHHPDALPRGRAEGQADRHRDDDRLPHVEPVPVPRHVPQARGHPRLARR